MKKFLNQNSKIKSILICLFLVILIVISEIFSFFSYQNDKKKYEMEEIKWKKIEAEKEEYNIPSKITRKDILEAAKELEEEGLVTLQKEGKARAQKTWIIPNMEVIASKKDEELKKDLKELAYKYNIVEMSDSENETEVVRVIRLLRDVINE